MILSRVMQIILFDNTKLTQQMRRQQLRSRAKNTRLAKKIMLSEEEHSIITSLLPKGYSLVCISDLQDHLKQEQIKKQSKSKAKDKSQSSIGARQPIEQKQEIQLPSNVNLNAQRTDLNTAIVKESTAENKNLARNAAPRKQYQSPKHGSKPKSTLDKTSSSLVNKAINDMINHTTFSTICDSRQKTPELLDQVNKIKRKAKKSYTIDAFQEDVAQLLQLYQIHNGKNSQVDAFERLVLATIQECSKQLSSIKETSPREQEEEISTPKDQFTQERRTRRRNQEKKVQTREDSSVKENEKRQELKKPQKKKEEKGNKPQQTDDSVSQSESLVMNLPKKKGRPKFQEILPRSKCSKILSSQVASLGFNFSKLTSEELYDILACLSGDKNLNMSQVSSEITVDLEQLSALQFVQLQAYVKNLLKSRNVEYENLVESDEDFVIEDDQ